MGKPRQNHPMTIHDKHLCITVYYADSNKKLY